MKDHVRSNWRNVVLVCRKCSRKLDGGFGPDGDERLAKALRKHLAMKKGRKAAAGIVEVDCLGVCPKGAVTVVNAARSHDWLLVRPGADLDRLADELGIGGVGIGGEGREASRVMNGAAPAADPAAAGTALNDQPG